MHASAVVAVIIGTVISVIGTRGHQRKKIVVADAGVTPIIRTGIAVVAVRVDRALADGQVDAQT
jgi:hypothetical protein